MDPMSGIAVACAVVQFVDFGTKVLTKAYEIGESEYGQTKEHLFLEAVTRDIASLSRRMSETVLQQSREQAVDAQVLLICKDCQATASVLLNRLRKFKAEREDSKSAILWKGLRSILSAREIKEMSEKLERYRLQLIAHILVTIETKIDKLYAVQRQDFSNLTKATEGGIDSILRGQEIIARNQDIQFSILSELMEREYLANRNQSDFFRGENAIHENELILNTVANRVANARNRLLNSLSYPIMEDRQMQIKDSHARTFEWIFEPLTEDVRPWSNFSSWLQEKENSLYWIKGKLGSGKSTLMLFLSSHPRLKTLLAEWSELPLLKASFFFWNSGSDLQRTQRGMLRSLLHQILSQSANLIRLVFPDYMNDEVIYRWNDRALMQTLRKICTQDIIPLKLFLLIDGLDEYEGDHIEIASFFKELSKLPCLKICVSSRPHQEFEVAFKESPKLLLQDLTANDIQAYVRDKLLGNPILTQIQRADEGETQLLVNTVVERAQGVFLWVALVCSSLATGLVAEDTLQVLQHRIETCPKKLNDLYAVLLQRIDSEHWGHSLRLFSLVRTALKARQQWIGKSRLQSDAVTAREILSADLPQICAIDKKIEPLDRSIMNKDLERLDTRLKTHCAGLLELVEGTAYVRSASGNNATYDRWPDESKHVEYVHRSAREFLDKAVFSEMRSIGDNGDVPGEKEESFDPYLALSSGTLMEIKSVRHEREEWKQSVFIDDLDPITGCQRHGLLWKASQVLIYASRTSKSSLSCTSLVIDELDRTMTVHWDEWLKELLESSGNYTDHFNPLDFNLSDSVKSTTVMNMLKKTPVQETSILIVAAKFGVDSYVEQKISDDPTVLQSMVGGSAESASSMWSKTKARLLSLKANRTTKTTPSFRKRFGGV